MGGEKEKTDRYAEQELLCWCILISIIDLLPHVEVVVSTGIEFERDAPHPVKHDKRAEHVTDVGESP